MALPHSTPTPTPPEWDVLLSAVTKNQLKKVQFLLTQSHVSPNHCNAVGQTALHLAAYHGHADIVKLLLQHKADPNRQNRLTSATPLHMALLGYQQRKQRPTTQRQKTTGRSRSLRGTSARHSSAHRSHDDSILDLVTTLLQYKASIEIVDDAGQRPIDYLKRHDANKHQNDDPVHASLLQRLQKATRQETSSPTEENVNDPSSLSETVRCFCKEIRGVVDQSCNQNQHLLDGVKAILEKAQTLCEAGANPNVPIPTSTDHDDDMDDGLPHATTVSLLEASLETMRDLCRDQNDGTVLGSPRIQMAHDMIRLLVKHGAILDNNPTDPWLHQAARRNQFLPLVACLVETVQVPINGQGRQGMTALHFAARAGHVAILEYLLTSCPAVDLSIRNDLGQTPLEAAKGNQQTRAVQLLESHLSKQHDS